MASILEGRQILLGVTGSIACYKAVDLASKLTQAGANVDVILTESAGRFVGPLSFRSVTGRQVCSDMWSLEDHVRHVKLGEAAELFVIAPATAHTIAKLAHGLADNLLTVSALAATCPLIVAPAMDGGMHDHPATQANLKLLQQRGVIVAGPAEGRMASGLYGKGRLLEALELTGHIRLALALGGPLAGQQVVVTAGPNWEPLDPLRYLSNRSTGRQGLALAQASLDAGAKVTLVAGPVHLPIPVGVRLVSVETAEQMCDAVLDAIESADVLLMAAAVADFRPSVVSEHKIKKDNTEQNRMSISLDRTPDILEQVKKYRQQSGFPRLTLGFAAESRDAIAYGHQKLVSKGLDYIAINDISVKDAGFAVETNRVVILGADGSELELPLQSKTLVAERIVELVASGLAARAAR